MADLRISALTAAANAAGANEIAINEAGTTKKITVTQLLAVGTNSIISNETPSGALDGSDVTYTLANSPITGTLKLYLNGQRLNYTEDYTLATNVITFVVPPISTDIIRADYELAGAATGNADTLDNLHATSFHLEASKATATENVAGTDDAKHLTALSNVPAFYSSLTRQAIINGNFDVWQRGTSFTNPASGTHTADRTRTVVLLDGGTDPTNVIHSRQLQTAGDLFGSNYFYRVNPDGAGSGYGANSGHVIQHNIENGTAKLCGASKTVTLSFYARSSIAGKKLGYYANQNYGTGGSPTAAEDIIGDKITLTSTWTKYTHIFTTNTLSSKTFGTTGDDWFKVNFVTQWGATLFGNLVNSSGAAETFVGAGNIDIAQVQLCAGDVALPFQPKSYEEELRACKRYYQAYTMVVETNVLCQTFGFPVEMRITPTPSGGGAGYTINGDGKTIAHYQNSRASNTMTFSAEL